MFDPWVTEHFGKADNALQGLRLLIIGESHNTDRPELYGTSYLTQTKEVIEKFAISQSYPIFDKLFHLVTSKNRKESTGGEVKGFWEAIAFYNFIPVFVEKEINRKKVDFLSGRSPLISVLNAIKPDAIIVCGLDTWWYVMDALPGGEGENPSRRDFARVQGALAVRIIHPSARGSTRYSYEVARPLIEKLFADVKVHT